MTLAPRRSDDDDALHIAFREEPLTRVQPRIISMSRSRRSNASYRHGLARHANALAVGRGARRIKQSIVGRKQSRGEYRSDLQYLPPEDWHEFDEDRDDCRYIVQEPGDDYAHVVTPEDVQDRLAKLPRRFTNTLRCVQFSRMTRKKRSFPCYGMQWGSTIYLYPLPENLQEYLGRPPKPAQLIEARMFGATWEQQDRKLWSLTWTPEAARDFYLNNILIHELGHLLDDRNRSYADRERFAEWFALEYGYKASRGK